MKKKIVWLIIVVVLLLGSGGYYWYSQIKIPYDNAVNIFQQEAKIVNNKNSELDSEIKKGQSILDSDENPLDKSTFTNLQIAISSAQEAKREVPTVPKKIEDVKNETSKLIAELDYSEVTSKLDNSINNYQDSIKQLKQVTNPTGDFIVTRIKNIDSIVDIMLATEENDPNGNLNKAGGYTSATFFSSTLVDQSKVYGTDVLDKGTDAGGCVEVYKTEEEANKRNDYLSSFDGAPLSSGSHRVVGTLVVRTSNEMTATNQKKLEEDIINKLISL